MPCNAIVMQLAEVNPQALYTSEKGLEQLVAYLKGKFPGREIAGTENFTELMKQDGRAWLGVMGVGTFGLSLSGRVTFPIMIEDDTALCEQIAKEIGALAGKFEQARLVLLLQAAMKGKAKLAAGPNGSFVLRGELAL